MRGRETPTGESGLMVIQVLHCPHCHGTDIVRHGTTRQGKQRYRCRTCPDRARTFLLTSAYAGQAPDVKRQIVDMALNASDIRDTARVLHVSPTTVSKELKKKGDVHHSAAGGLPLPAVVISQRAEFSTGITIVDPRDHLRP